MEKRIKIFNSNYPEDIEYQVNDFLRKTKGRLHDVTYDRDLSVFDDKHTILITYSEEGGNEEKNKNAEKNEKGHARVQGRITPLWEQVGAGCKV